MLHHVREKEKIYSCAAKLGRGKVSVKLVALKYKEVKFFIRLVIERLHIKKRVLLILVKSTLGGEILNKRKNCGCGGHISRWPRYIL